MLHNMQAGVINDLVLLSAVGVRPVLVHGGGPEINIWLNKLGIEAQFKDGLRVTDGEGLAHRWNLRSASAPEACLRSSLVVIVGRYIKQGWPNPTLMPGSHLTVADRCVVWAVSGTLPDPPLHGKGMPWEPCFIQHLLPKFSRIRAAAHSVARQGVQSHIMKVSAEAAKQPLQWKTCQQRESMMQSQEGLYCRWNVLL